MRLMQGDEKFTQKGARKNDNIPYNHRLFCPRIFGWVGSFAQILLHYHNGECMMQRLKKPVLLVLIGLALASLAFTALSQQTSELVRGALLYDNWMATLQKPAPDGNMPIWARQSTNSRSGEATWRCAECHGWDYKGKDGAYASGSHLTGFPGIVSAAKNMTEEEIVAHLNGQRDPAHDFSAYIPAADLQLLASFIKNGLIDDDDYIDDLSLRIKNANLANGEKRYNDTCAACHGVDGKNIVFRTEGVDEYLGSVANRDPWRFLHRTRYGVAGTSMPVAVSLGWKVTDGRDVLAYAQTLPTGQETTAPAPAGAQSGSGDPVGGPATDLWSGILTGIAAFVGIFGGALLFGAILVAIGAAVVFIFRRR
jgi:mono/diheme cytochrome c family protein